MSICKPRNSPASLKYFWLIIWKVSRKASFNGKMIKWPARTSYDEFTPQYHLLLFKSGDKIALMRCCEHFGFIKNGQRIAIDRLAVIHCVDKTYFTAQGLFPPP